MNEFITPERAKIRDLQAEVARLTALIKDGARVANALTLETQTPEDMATDLVRQVRDARRQRDEKQVEIVRLSCELKELLTALDGLGLECGYVTAGEGCEERNEPEKTWCSQCKALKAMADVRGPV